MNITVRVMTKQAAAMLASLESQINGVSSRASRVNTGSGQFDKATKSIKGFGNSLQWAGYQLLHAFTIPILGAGAAALKYQLDVDKAFTNVAKVYGDTELQTAIGAKGINDELEALRQNFRALSDEYGVNQVEVNQVAEAWAAAGVSGLALSKATEESLKTMIIGDLNAADATKALIAIQAQYGASTEGLIKIMEALNATENITGATTADLITGFQRTAGVAASSGVPYKNLAGFIAALVPAAGTAANAGNALKTILTDLLAPTTKGSAALKAIGINVQSMGWKTLTGAQRVELLSRKYKDLDGNQKIMFSNAVVGKYQISRFNQLMLDVGKSFDSTGKRIANNSTKLGYYGRTLAATASDASNAKVAQGELNAVLNSQPHRLQQVWVWLKNTSGEIVQNMIPTIITLVGTLASMAAWFGRLNPYWQKFFGILILGLAILGPVLLYVASISKLLHLIGSGAVSAGSGFMKMWRFFSGGTAYGEKKLAEFFATQAQLQADLETLLAETLASIDAMATESATATAATINGAAESMAATYAATGASIINTIWGENTVLSTQLLILKAIEAQVVKNTAVMLASARTSGAAEAAATAASAPRALHGKVDVIDVKPNSVRDEIIGPMNGAAREGEGIFTRMWGSIKGIFVRGAVTTGGALRAILPASIGTAITAAGSAVADGLSAIGALFLATPPGWIVLIVLALAAIFLIFRHQLTSIAKSIYGWMSDIASAFWSGIKQLPDLVVTAINQVANGFAALPGIVVASLQAVVNVVYQAAMEVYDLFSYLDPFAHHSPSLVENVTRGLDVIARKFAGITSISVPIKRAYSDIKTFGKAIAGLIQQEDQAKQSEDLANLAKFAPSAIASYKELQSDLVVLNADYARLGIALKNQQAITDAYKQTVDDLNFSLDIENNKLKDLQTVQQDWSDKVSKSQDAISALANTGITGMRAMSDQIFANDQAQKQLQLQMLKMEDVIGPIDKVQGKLADLQGQIELLKGEQSNLRAGGAGSEILSQYDQQIAALQAQQGATQDQINQYNQLSDSLAALQHQADELDLENSLQFDPLTRQVDQLVNGLNELPFDDIIAKIKKEQAALDINTKRYNDATTAVNKQQAVVDALTKKRDAAQQLYDIENNKLGKIQQAYDNVGQAISDVKDQLQLMDQAATAANAALKKAAGNANPLGTGGGLTSAAGKGTFGREGGLVDQAGLIAKDTQDRINKLKNAMGQLDLFGPLKSKFRAAGDWIHKWIWDEPAKWGDWISSKVKSGAESAYGWVGNLGSSVVHGLETSWHAVTNWFNNLPGELLNFVKDFPHLLEQAGKDLLYGLGYGIGFGIGLVIRIVATLIVGIYKLFSGASNWLRSAGIDILKGLWQGIVNFWPIVLQFFADLPGHILDYYKSAGTFMYDIGIDILKGAYNGAISFFPVLIGFFVDLPSNIKKLFLNAPKFLYQSGRDILGGLWNGITSFFGNIWSGISTFISGFVDGFKKALGIHSPSTVFQSIGTDILRGLLNGLTSFFGNILSFFGSLPGRILGALGDLRNLLHSKGADLLGGLINGIESVVGRVADLGSAVAHNILRTIDNVLPHRVALNFDKGPIHIHEGIDLIPHFFAKGGIVDEATLAMIGEAGKEVVIPLTDSRRALELAQTSGLVDLIGKSGAFNNTNTAKLNAAWGTPGSGAATQTTTTVTHNDYSTHETKYEFNNAQFSFPNIKSKNDAGAFLRNLEIAAKGGQG